MKNTEQVLKFGKFKGQAFSATPTWYQEWLLKQDWFNKPLDAMGRAQKEFSDANRKMRSWDGYSRRGAYYESKCFEAEQAMADAADSDWFKETYGY